MQRPKPITASLLPAIFVFLAFAGTATSCPSIFENEPPWDTWGNPIYKNPDNPFVQSVQVGGRMNYQVVNLWGNDLNGESFEDSFDELRRLWVGGKINLLHYFQVGGNAIIASDERPQGGDVDLGYQKFFDLYVAADLRSIFDLSGIERLRFRYGRIKHSMSYTGRQTQRFNKSVERTALSNKLYNPFAAMSATIDLDHGPWSHQLSLYGTENGGAAYGSLNHSEWGSWDDGLALYLWNRYDYSGAAGLDKAYLHFEGAYNFADENDSSWLGYRWAGTLSTYIEQGRWTFLIEAAIGDNGDENIGLLNPDRQGLFWGTQVESTYWLYRKYLEGVIQFAWMGSENPEGIRIDRRYVGLPHTTDSGTLAQLNNRYGERHRSIYLGLNYYMPDDRNKIMLGLEWEELSTADGADAEMATCWAAYRMYF